MKSKTTFPTSQAQELYGRWSNRAACCAESVDTAQKSKDLLETLAARVAQSFLFAGLSRREKRLLGAHLAHETRRALDAALLWLSLLLGLGASLWRVCVRDVVMFTLRALSRGAERVFSRNGEKNTLSATTRDERAWCALQKSSHGVHSSVLCGLSRRAHTTPVVPTESVLRGVERERERESDTRRAALALAISPSPSQFHTPHTTPSRASRVHDAHTEPSLSCALCERALWNHQLEMCFALAAKALCERAEKEQEEEQGEEEEELCVDMKDARRVCDRALELFLSPRTIVRGLSLCADCVESLADEEERAQRMERERAAFARECRRRFLAASRRREGVALMDVRSLLRAV